VTADFRRLLPTPCRECVVDIEAWRDESNVGEWPEGGRVTVGLLSSHDLAFFHSWRGKLYRLGLVLKGESYPWLELYDREQADEFVSSLAHALEVAFPRPHDSAH
jgi:hypothetical protein